MAYRKELERLAELHGSDKHGAHRYMQHYAKFFSPLRDKPVNLLEIGIGGFDDPIAGGSSLRMWKEFFPLGRIIGLDIIDKSVFNEERIEIVQGSQVDPTAIADVISRLGGQPLNVIIDDGSHLNEHVMSTFCMLFPYLAAGGIYVIEDLQTSYLPNFGGSFSDLQNARTSMNFLKSLTDGLNWEEIHRPLYKPTYLDLNIVGISFYHNIAFVEKGDNQEGSNTLTDHSYPLFS